MFKVDLARNPEIGLSGAHVGQCIVVRDGTMPISERAFLADVSALKAQLPEREYVFNFCRDRYWFMVAFCAAVSRNQVNLLPPNQNANTVQEILRDYPDAYCVSDESGERDLHSLNIVELLGASGRTSNRQASLSVPARQRAAIAFTSGSTGRPGAHEKPWGALSGTALLLRERFVEQAGNSPILSTVPSQHMYGLEAGIMMALVGGQALCRAHPFYPADIVAHMAKCPEPVTLVSTPPHLRSLVESGLQLPAAALVVSATAPLDRGLAREVAEGFQAPVREVYGCTEAGSLATRNPLTDDQWTLLEGIELHAKDDEITVDAPHLAGPIAIEDKIQPRGDWHFTLLGRPGDTVNIAGKRESIGNITTRLLDIDGVDDAVVFLPPEERRNPRLAALVVSSLPERHIVDQLSTVVDAAFLPRPLKKVDALPRNETGKITAATIDDLWRSLHGT